MLLVLTPPKVSMLPVGFMVSHVEKRFSGMAFAAQRLSTTGIEELLAGAANVCIK